MAPLWGDTATGIDTHLNMMWQVPFPFEFKCVNFYRKYTIHIDPCYLHNVLYMHTYLLLISMLWQRQAIFKSKGDKLCSSPESRIWTRDPRHQIASRLNARWQTDHISRLTEGLAQRQLDLEVHRRKWNSVKVVAKEEDEVTRGICKDFVHTVLQVTDAKENLFAACHHLSPQPNAGIIVRFMGLALRDRWLVGTKHLKNQSGKVTMGFVWSVYKITNGNTTKICAQIESNDIFVYIFYIISLQ